MRIGAFPAVLVGALLVASPARADDSDGALAVLVGGATTFAGFVVGGTLIAVNSGYPATTEAGWFVIESGFSLAPLTAHAVMGEWVRGAVFSAVPAATTLATIPVFGANEDSVDHGSLPQQRVMWGLFCGGLAASVAGVIDAAFAPGRAIHVAPVLGRGSTGLIIEGAL